MDISTSVADNGLESKVLEFLEEIHVPIGLTLVKYCHRLPSKNSPKKVIIKINRRKDICRILLNKNNLKNSKAESVNLPRETKISINENLCLYYMRL